MLPIQITFRSMPFSPTVQYLVNKYYKKLKRSYSKISRCNVVIDFARKKSHKDKIFSIRIDLSLPGKELVSKKQNENIYLAIQGGFNAIEKLLEKHYKRKIAYANKYSNYFDIKGSSYENEYLSGAEGQVYP